MEEKMIDKLPYVLTTGVTATREGLVFDDDAGVPMAACSAAEGHIRFVIGMRTVWAWPRPAERLRY
ncbi:MAG TPA: hypothetical protein VKP88_04065, partial [Candidatus Paceibacterota bacterium]|nr:hypothetical protein [Candidatus Paceibacterota bacterium]